MKFDDFSKKTFIVFDLYRKKLKASSKRMKRHEWTRKHIGTYKSLQEVWEEILKDVHGKLAHDVYYVGDDVELSHITKKRGELTFITTTTQSWPSGGSSEDIQFPTKWWIEVKFKE